MKGRSIREKKVDIKIGKMDKFYALQGRQRGAQLEVYDTIVSFINFVLIIPLSNYDISLNILFDMATGDMGFHLPFSDSFCVMHRMDRFTNSARPFITC